MKKVFKYLLLVALVPAMILTGCKKNNAPTADAGADQTVEIDQVVTLDATASNDTDGDALTYAWDAPADITLSDVAVAQPTFTAPFVEEETAYTITLTVSDGELEDTDEVVITVTATPVEAGFPILKQYLMDNDMDLPDMLAGWIIDPVDVHDNLAGFYIMDIRGETDFDAGHIDGAVHSSLATIVEDADAAKPANPIVVCCYTGQTAGHAVTALRLSGYADAKVMKWGMSGWNDNLASPWEGGVGNTGIGNASWSLTNAIVDNQTFADPTWTVEEGTTGEDILAERIAVLVGGFNGVANGDVLGDPDSYFINNYWASDDVDHYGHIVGAHRISPLSLENGEYLYLDPDAGSLVTYCWTGQTSSMITAWLKVLGYNAVSLKFGANGMIYDNLESHKWALQGNNFELVTK